MRRGVPLPGQATVLEVHVADPAFEGLQASSTSSPAGRKLPVSKQAERAGQPCKNRSTPWVVLKGAAGVVVLLHHQGEAVLARQLRQAADAVYPWPGSWRSCSWGGSFLSRKPGMTRSFLAPR